MPSSTMRLPGLGPGLNLLTGETGAGKSILIDALVLLLGGKASSDVVRFGAEKAVLGCVFETTPGAEEILERNGIDPEGDEILLRREIAVSGKGRVFVNNQPGDRGRAAATGSGVGAGACAVGDAGGLRCGTAEALAGTGLGISAVRI